MDDDRIGATRRRARSRRPRAWGRLVAVRVLAASRDDAVFVAISDPRAGLPARHTLWKLPLGLAGDPVVDLAVGARIAGREVDLPLCRRIALGREFVGRRAPRPG